MESVGYYSNLTFGTYGACCPGGHRCRDRPPEHRSDATDHEAARRARRVLRHCVNGPIDAAGPGYPKLPAWYYPHGYRGRRSCPVAARRKGYGHETRSQHRLLTCRNTGGAYGTLREPRATRAAGRDSSRKGFAWTMIAKRYARRHRRCRGLPTGGGTVHFSLPERHYLLNRANGPGARSPAAGETRSAGPGRRWRRSSGAATTGWPPAAGRCCAGRRAAGALTPHDRDARSQPGRQDEGRRTQRPDPAG